MKNFVDKESGVTVFEEPYIEDESDAPPVRILGPQAVPSYNMSPELHGTDILILPTEAMCVWSGIPAATLTPNKITPHKNKVLLSPSALKWLCTRGT